MNFTNSPIFLNALVVLISFFISIAIFLLYRKIQRKKSSFNKMLAMHFEEAEKPITAQLDSLLEDRKINQELINKLTSGYLVSDIPIKMVLGKSYKVNISFTNTNYENSSIMPHAEIKLGHYIEAVMWEEFFELDPFKIKGDSRFNKKLPLFQLSKNDLTKQVIWKGWITPIKSGEQTLDLRVNSYYPDEDDFIHSDMKEQTILVEKNIRSILYNLSELIKKHDKWFILIFGTGIIIPLMKFILKAIFGI